MPITQRAEPGPRPRPGRTPVDDGPLIFFFILFFMMFMFFHVFIFVLKAFMLVVF